MAPKGGKEGKGGKATAAAKGGKDKAKGKDSGKAGASAAPAKGAQKGAQTISVRHILCEKHARKEEALAALQAGRAFDDVAREFSEDKARAGGALGWKTRGSLLPEFEAVAFELEASTTGKPKYAEVRTSEGYHLVMVDGRK